MVHWIPAAWRRRSYNLRWMLVAVPVLVVLPILLHSVLLLQLVSDRAARELREDIDQGSHALAAAVDHQLAGATGLLELLAASPSLRADSIEAERFSTIVRTVLEGGWGLQSVTLRDREGRNLMGGLYRSDDGTSPLYPHEQQALESMQPAISDLYLAGSVERPATSIAVPVVREGRPLWVLSGRLDPVRLSSLLLEQMPRHESVAALLDGNRTIIARSRDGDRWFGERASPDTVEALESAPAGVRRIRTRDGDHLLWSWTTLPNGWSLFLGTPAESYEGPLRASMLRLALTGLLALALGIGLAALVARRVLRSVDAMTANARHLAHGKVPVYRRSGIRQLDALYRALNAASRRVVRALRERAVALQAERAARSEAEAANRAKDEFISMLSHELRNPMAPIANAHKILERTQALNGDGRAALAMASRQTAQLKRLVDDLLDATRITQRKIELRPERVDVAAAVQQVVQTVAPVAAQRGQPFTVAIEPDAGEIVADPARIQQVLENLLGNAAKFTRETDAIRVDVHGDADAVEIRVTDDGIGIEAASLSRVFDLFAQADITIDRTQGGLGIGLAWVKSIVEMHGGNVSAASAGKGRGACFTVRLPRLPSSLIGRMPLAAERT
jgi:signal transduction histidine kinase